MKLHFFLLVSIILNRVKGLPEKRNNKLQRAFLDIAIDLAKRNYMLSVVSTRDDSYASEEPLFEIFSRIPHIVVDIFYENESKRVKLNSSVFVSLETVASLKVFRNYTEFPSTFMASQQVIIHCDEASITDIKTSSLSIRTTNYTE